MSSRAHWLIPAVNAAAVVFFLLLVESGQRPAPARTPLSPRGPGRVIRSVPSSVASASTRDVPSARTRTASSPSGAEAAGTAPPAPAKPRPTDFQLGRQLPVGWVARRLEPDQSRETRICFQVASHPGIEPTIHYHPFPDPVIFWSNDVRMWLGNSAGAKESQRVREGFAGYRNRGEMTPRIIGNRAALSWSADFTRNGVPWVENLTRLFSPAGTALFFLQAPASEIDDVQGLFDIVIESSIMPSLALSESVASTYHEARAR